MTDVSRGEDDDLDQLEAAQLDSWLRRNWLFGLMAVFSLVWIILAYLIIWSSPSCDLSTTAQNIIDYRAVLGSSLLCRPINEIGDFLAGAFSPLAFLWLFAAVVLQKGELAAQRRELSLARAVSIAQTKEARKNVKLLDAQTSVFQAQMRLEAVEVSDREIQIIVDAYMREINSHTRDGSKGIHVDIDMPDKREKSIRFLGHTDKVGDAAITYHRDHLVDRIREFDEINPRRGDCNFHGGGFIFKHLNEYSEQITRYLPNISVAKRLHLSQVGLTSIIFRLSQIESLFGKMGNKWVSGGGEPVAEDVTLKIGN